MKRIIQSPLSLVGLVALGALAVSIPAVSFRPGRRQPHGEHRQEEEGAARSARPAWVQGCHRSAGAGGSDWPGGSNWSGGCEGR